MSEYTAIVTDFKTGDVTTEAPILSFEASAELNRAESLSITLPLAYSPFIDSSLTVSTSGLESVDNYVPAKNAVFIVRNGVVLYGGLIWAVPTLNVTAESFVVAGKGMLSYLRRRRIKQDQVFAAKDSDFVATALVDLADNVAINTATLFHGTSIDYTVFGYDRLTIETAVENIANTATGFDHRFTHGVNGNAITSTFRTSYPAGGRTINTVLDAEDCSSFNVSFDATAMANNVEAKAALVGEDPIIVSAANAAATATYPQLDDLVHVDDVTDRTLLHGIAQRAVNRLSMPTTRISVEKAPDTVLSPNEYTIGEHIRVRANVGGLRLDGQFRIVADGLMVDSDGKETHMLTLVNSEVYQ